MRIQNLADHTGKLSGFPAEFLFSFDDLIRDARAHARTHRTHTSILCPGASFFEGSPLKREHLRKDSAESAWEALIYQQLVAEREGRIWNIFWLSKVNLENPYLLHDDEWHNTFVTYLTHDS